MVPRIEEPGTAASVVLAPTSIGTVAKAELLEGQWRLVKLLGQGAVGQVWQAHDVTLDRPVAVKLMHAAVAERPDEVARFEREAKALAALEHPNLLPVLGLGRLGTRPFLVTRLLEGRTLAEAMHERGGKLPAAEAARILVPVCDALHCLHEARVVHRDVKPSNIFVGDDQRITLMDLGSAHAQGSELTRLGEVLGTEGYLSPEQKAGRRDLDGKSDVFSLGCLLREMLGDTAPLLLTELARLATSTDPRERPTALELKAKLAPYLANEEATSPVDRALEAPTRQAVFTPTTGSPSYPDLPAAVVSGPPPTSSTLLLPLSVAVPTSATTVIPVGERVTAKRSRPMDGRVLIALAVVFCALLVTFIAGLVEPEPQPLPPMRVDKPAVPAPIQRELTQLHGMVEAPKPMVAPAPLPMPRLVEKKAAANRPLPGYVPWVPRPADMSRVPVGKLRITTTVNGIVTPAKAWVQWAPNGPFQKLREETPTQIGVRPGRIVVRLQYRDEPVLDFPWLTLSLAEQLRETQNDSRHLLEEMHNDGTHFEGVSKGEFRGNSVSKSDGRMTRRNPGDPEWAPR